MWQPLLGAFVHPSPVRSGGVTPSPEPRRGHLCWLYEKPRGYFPWGSLTGANAQDAYEPRKGNSPATGPLGAHISPSPWGHPLTAGASQPEAPSFPGCESPISFSLE